jgi:hypothetical protein
VHLTRRRFIETTGAAGLFLSASPALVAGAEKDAVQLSDRIDRRALVRRHNPVVTRFDPFSALSVGNGEAAFTADITGLQTFTSECEKKFPLCTASHWAWHSAPAPAGLRREDFRYKDYDTYGRPVGYATSATGQEALFTQLWRERLGLPPEARWDEVLKGLAPLPVQDGCYLMQEGLTDTYTNWNWEHPALLGALGMQPGDGVDAPTMRRTVKRVIETWHWEKSWGWDFPLTAMAAARVGEPGLAVKSLLMDEPKNRYWPNGHNYQRDGLTAYLPGNGGLLSAIAMMAAGWTDGPNTHAPGFPEDGRWKVAFEGLRQWI